MVERPRFGCVDSVLGAHVEVLTRLVPTCAPLRLP
jgi:hypothetical protein